MDINLIINISICTLFIMGFIFSVIIAPIWMEKKDINSRKELFELLKTIDLPKPDIYGGFCIDFGRIRYKKYMDQWTNTYKHKWSAIGKDIGVLTKPPTIVYLMHFIDRYRYNEILKILKQNYNKYYGEY